MHVFVYIHTRLFFLSVGMVYAGKKVHGGVVVGRSEKDQGIGEYLRQECQVYALGCQLFSFSVLGIFFMWTSVFFLCRFH